MFIRVCRLIGACPLLLTLALMAGCPKNASTLYHDAQALQAAQQFGPALAAYDKALAQDPQSKMALFGKAVCSYKLNKFDVALPLFEDFLKQTEAERATFKDERFDAEFYRDKCKQALGQDVAQDPAQIPPPPMGE